MLSARVIERSDGWAVKVYPDHEHAVVDFGALYVMPCATEQEADLLKNAWEHLDDGEVHNIRRRGLWPGGPWPSRDR